MNKIFISFTSLLIWLVSLQSNCFGQGQHSKFDVKSYELKLEVNIAEKSIQGELLIGLEAEVGINSIALDARNLIIDELSGSEVASYHQHDSKLIIELSESHQTRQEIHIRYHGNPARGLLFNSDLEQVHTVYFTEDWMPCHFIPADKAKLSLKLLIPKEKVCIASGELKGKEEKGDKTLYSWQQNYESPAYTYGFVIGTFTKVQEEFKDVTLNYYSAKLSKTELKKVFEETYSMLQFFEEKTGIPYVQRTYSQVLIGGNFQEISGMAVFNTSYSHAVFKDSSEIHLTAHELAHQWWGNMITCEDFGHFWLNEAFAVYMATAFNECRFGKGKYESDIALYKGIYDDVKKRGKDKALVFKKWVSTIDNRNVVYYKGAYVLHLLREEIGEEAFWKGIKSYTKNNWGGTVNTEHFQVEMEKVSGIDLDTFFKKWVYSAS
ncbi:MAG: M1 family aminopeptidase [Bacteroidota bacterium]